MSILLRDVCELIIDCEHKTAPTQPAGYLSIRTPNIGRGFLKLDDVNRVSEDTYRAWTKRAVPQPGDLVMAREAPVGNVAMIPEGLQPCLGQRTLLIRPNRTKVVPRYLAYLLLGDEMQAAIHALTNGVTVPHLNMGDVRQLPLPELPPLDHQRYLAQFIGAFDDLVENNLRRIRILEEMARVIYREWFVHFRFPGHEGVAMVDSPLGRIPMGWETRRLLEMARVVYGYPFASSKFNSAGAGLPIVRIRDIPDGSTETWTDEIADPKYVIANGDILVGMDGNFHMCIWPGGVAYQNQRVARVMPGSEIGRYHLFLALQEPIQALNFSIVGTTVAHLGDKHIQELLLVRPPSALLRRTKEVLDPMAEEILLLRQANSVLRVTRDLLLPRLMSGRLSLACL